MNARKLLLVGAVAAFGVLAPVAASADDNYVNTSVPTTTPPTVEGTILTRTSDGPKPSVLGSTQTRAPGGLPVTGGDIAELALIGAGAVATGTVLVRRSRRPSAQPA